MVVSLIGDVPPFDDCRKFYEVYSSAATRRGRESITSATRLCIKPQFGFDVARSAAVVDTLSILSYILYFHALITGVKMFRDITAIDTS